MAKKVEIGERIAAQYLIEGELGEGGAGYVMRALDQTTGGKVALKFLLDAGPSNTEMIARFRREASSAAKLTSEHAIRIHEVQTLDDGQHYMVMELLEGQDLDQLIEARKCLDIAEGVDLVLQACEALAEAHSLGIVHRDLKPANLFVTQRDGRAHVKVLDFGISKVKDSSAKLTRTASVMGSPEFMPPEQLQGAKFVDARSDLWALGVILYEALTGALPFPGNNIGTLTFQIVTAEPDPPNKHRPDIPPGLAAVILRCLEKKTLARWQSVAELAEALEYFGTPAAKASVAVIKRWQPNPPVYSNSPSMTPPPLLSAAEAKGIKVVPPPVSSTPSSASPMIGVGVAPTTLQLAMSPALAERVLASSASASASTSRMAASGAATGSSTNPSARSSTSSAASSTASSSAGEAGSAAASRWILIALGVLILLAIVVLVVVATRSKPKGHSERNEFDPEPKPSPTFSLSTYV